MTTLAEQTKALWMFTSDSINQSAPGDNLAIALLTAVLHPDELRGKRKYLPQLGMDQGGLNELVIPFTAPRGLPSTHAQRTVDALAVEILRSVHRQKIFTLVELIPLKLFAALKSTEVLAKDPGKGLVVMAIDYISQLTVRRDLGHAKDRAQVVALHLILESSLELKNGGILKVEHRVCTEVAIT